MVEEFAYVDYNHVRSTVLVDDDLQDWPVYFDMQVFCVSIRFFLNNCFEVKEDSYESKGV